MGKYNGYLKTTLNQVHQITKGVINGKKSQLYTVSNEIIFVYSK